MNQEIENLPNSQEDKSSHNLDKVFFTFALAYLGLGLYWINQPKLVEHPTKETKQAVSNSQFLAYLEQSLKIIKETPLQQQNASSFPKSQNTIVEKVYIPLYPPPVPSSIPLPPKLPQVISVPVPHNPFKVISIPTPGFKKGGNPKPLSVIPVEQNHSTVLPTPPNIIPEPTIELKGVLESETSSVALFSFQGITKRLQVGDIIGSSGWVFQGVTQQRAIISKEGKTRYIEVGQKF